MVTEFADIYPVLCFVQYLSFLYTWLTCNCVNILYQPATAVTTRVKMTFLLLHAVQLGKEHMHSLIDS